MNTINKMSRSEALTTLLKVAKLHDKLVKKLAFLEVGDECSNCGSDLGLGGFQMIEDGVAVCEECANNFTM